MRKIGLMATVILVSTLALSGCAPDPVFDAQTTPNGQEGSHSGDTSTPDGDPAEPSSPAEPITQEETCDWESPAMTSGSTAAPQDQNGELATALIGAWQHTHINEGSAFEPVGAGTDIRYIFPSSSRLLYCQDVAGATHQAENATDLTIEGTTLILGASGVSYGVVAWDANAMVWKNHRDGSLYLLQRR